MPPEDLLQIAQLPRLTPKQWRQVEAFLEDWKADVLAAAARHPAKGYHLGYEQARAFMKLIGRLHGMEAHLAAIPAGTGSGSREAVAWAKRYTLRELEDALDAYVGKIKDALIYGLRSAVNPAQLASWLYRATQDGEVNWRAIARTEMVRANAAGRLDALAHAGYEQVWAPSHVGACKSCRRLLENQTFDLQRVRNATNYGRKPGEWVACIPLHPHCRHTWLPYIPEVYDEFHRQVGAVRAAGLSDEKLDQMFDSSGQLRPEYEGALDWDQFKTHTGSLDPYEQALERAVLKLAGPRRAATLERVPLSELRTDLYQRAPDPIKVAEMRGVLAAGGRLPPPKVSRRADGTLYIYDGQHRVAARGQLGEQEIECLIRDGLSWEEENRLCQDAIAKGFFDPEQIGLDPLLFTGEQLRPEIPARLHAWAQHALGGGYERWARLYLTGGATSHQYLSPTRPEQDPDVDLQIVVDYPALRAARPGYAPLADQEIHAALVTAVRAHLHDTELVPGVRLDAFIRPETSQSEFQADARLTGQSVWDLAAGDWLIANRTPPSAELVREGLPIIAGAGAAVALAHPAWLTAARAVVKHLHQALARHAQADTPELRAACQHELSEAYHLLHDARQASFQAGGGGNEGRGNFIWQYAWNFGPLLRVKQLAHPTEAAKIFPDHSWSDEQEIGKTTGGEFTRTGMEHWITVHPHGDEEKGIPVLVRENGDGTATIIGGAGGHLDFVRLSGKSRMKDGQTRPSGKDPRLEHQPLSEAEAEQKRAAYEQAAEQARTVKESAQGARRDYEQKISDYLGGLWNQRGTAGVPWEKLEEPDRRKLLARAYATAHEQASYGTIMDRSLNEAGPLLLNTKKSDGEAEQSEPREREEPNGEPSEPGKPSVPLLALSGEESEALLGLYEARAAAGRSVRQANKVISGEVKPSDASDLQWRPESDLGAAAQRRAARLAETQLKRSVLGMAENPRVASETASAVERGAFEAFDAVSYQVFGRTLLPTRVQRLLKVTGTAQLMAYELQQQARAGKVDLRKVRQSLDEITDERQAQLLDLDVKRAQYALKTASAMSEEEKQSQAGNSLYTVTQAKSRRSKKLREAANALGMAIAGSESVHTLRSMLQQPIDRVEVPGFASKGQIHDLAAKARIKVNESDIVRVGAGNYTLRLAPERFERMLKPSPQGPGDETQQFLAQIRTRQGLDEEIEQARTAPGYTRRLDLAQAQGSLYLRHAKGALLAFAPGVGKTDTALAAFAQLRHDEPEKNHRLLVIAPATAVSEDGAWPKTVREAFPGTPYETLDAGSERRRAKAGESAPERAPILITSMDWIKRQSPEMLKTLGHTVVAADESQYAKSESSQRAAGLDAAAHGLDYRWALSGTPLEKNMGELYTQMNWARPGAFGTREAFTDRYGQINQWDHLTAEEQAQQFRESLSSGLFHQGQNMSGMPRLARMQWEDAPLTDGHQDVYRQAVQGFNSSRARILEQRRVLREDHGYTASQAVAASESMPYFGGHNAQMDALMKPEKRGYAGPNMRNQKIADLIAHNPPVKFAGFKGHAVHADGSHAGTYQPKSIVFGREVEPLKGIASELGARGTHKVFFTRGGDPVKNDRVLREFISHPGPAVLITSDTNKTARNLQFGDNGGRFQHGATQVIHADVPQNNADLQQRVARAWRRGAQAPVSEHVIYSGTPAEQRMREQLESELLTQQAVGNPEDLVARHGGQGRETIRQKLTRMNRRRSKEPAHG